MDARSARPLEADVGESISYVGFGPLADIDEPDIRPTHLDFAGGDDLVWPKLVAREIGQYC
jgi:hypothetical protein